MFDAFVHHLHVFVVGDGRCNLAFCLKWIDGKVPAVEHRNNLVHLTFVSCGNVFHNHHLVFEVIHHDDVFVENIDHFGSVARLHGSFSDFYVFEMLHRVVAGVPEKSVDAGGIVVVVHVKLFHEVLEQSGEKGILFELDFVDFSIGILLCHNAFLDHEFRQRFHGDKRITVVHHVEIGAFEQCRFGENIAHLQVEAHRRLKVCQQCLAAGFYFVVHFNDEV